MAAIHRPLLPALALVVSVCGAEASTDPAAPSAAASAARQGPVLGWIRAQEYSITAAPDGSALTAPNRAHGLRARWSAPSGRLELGPRTTTGASWSFSYELSSIGRGRTPGLSAPVVPAAAVTAETLDGGRLEWTRSRLREWYVNDARGVEQGFVLGERPDGDASLPVVVEGRIAGLLAFPAEDGRSVLLRTAAGEDALRIRDLVAYDASRVELRACLEVGNGVLRIVVDDRKALYPVTIDPLMTSPAWTAEGNQADARFGVSVASAGDVNGDGYSDVLVGADHFDNGEADEGAAFVFLGSPSGLSPTPFWSAESNQADARFGASVASAGDVNGDGFSDVIVGAPLLDGGTPDQGGVFVYLGGPAGLSTPWLAAGGQGGAAFGRSVAPAGDVNGDGFDDVIVGAPSYDGGETDEGRTVVYHGSPSGLVAVPAWTRESNQAGAAFGSAVATAGDVNGDGYADVVVGAPSWTGGATAEGAAFAYFGSASGLATTATWTALGGQANASFGGAVSTAGDVDGDGFADILVGAFNYDNGQVDEGRAYLYRGAAGGIAAAPSSVLESNQAVAAFGFSVATAGDINGDGYADVVIGAPFYDGVDTDEGRAFVYQGLAAGLAATPAWMSDGDQPFANHGIAVAPAGDVNGDGFSDVVVGAWLFDGGQADEGRAAVYNGASTGLAPVAAWTAESNQASSGFGFAVESAGDVNGDGYGDVVVSAPFYDNDQLNEGRVFVFHGSSNGLLVLPSWTAESNQADAHFFTEGKPAGDFNGDGYTDLVVTASAYDDGELNEGRVFVYAGSPSGLSATAAWTLDGNQVLAALRACFVGDVNGDGFSDLGVGSPAYDGDQFDEGRVWLYLGSATGFGPAPVFVAESNQASAGFSIEGAGDVNGDGYSDILLVASDYADGEIDEGRVTLQLGSALGPAATPAWTVYGEQAQAHLGARCAKTAGDVNGDDYGDVIVGSYQYDNGQVDEGRAYVYLGSAAGLATLPAWTAEGDQANAHFGADGGSAGDVNGDGYGDVFVVADEYDGDQVNEGRVYLYLGSPSGLAPTPAWTAEGNQVNAFLGHGGSAGDVNGDGYGDLIVAGTNFTNDQPLEGRAFLYYGNGGDGLDRLPRQARADGSAPIDVLGAATAGGFLVRANGRIPFGRGAVRLEIEVKPLGTAFDGTGVLTTGYTDTGAPGAEGSRVALERLFAPFPTSGPYHWRARLRARAPVPWQSHWMSLAYNTQTETDLRSSCFVDGDCDDAKPCSIDTCVAGACSHLAAPVTVVCRPPAGACDLAEHCTGTSATCPVDLFEPASTPCRPAAGPCDVAESCTGADATCPADTLEPASTPCRPAAGPCDVAESCTGTDATCPADTLEPASTPCRPAVGTCDRAESCTGLDAACPSDTFEPPTTPCDDGQACTTGDACNGLGQCLAGAGPTFTRISGVLAVKALPAVVLWWSADPQASQYHANRVSAKRDLTDPRRVPGLGTAACEVAAPALTCTDPLAFALPDPILFYQVLSACGPGGGDEGPY